MDEFDDFDDDMVVSFVHIHVVFSTKNQEPLISEDMSRGLWETMGDIVREKESTIDCIGGTADHVHIVVAPSVNVSLNELIRAIKKGSAEWVRETYPEMKNFAWQEGYAGFAVSTEHLSTLAIYIDGQAKHHETISFQDEYRALLIENGIEFDEKDLFD